MLIPGVAHCFYLDSNIKLNNFLNKWITLLLGVLSGYFLKRICYEPYYLSNIIFSCHLSKLQTTALLFTRPNVKFEVFNSTELCEWSPFKRSTTMLTLTISFRILVRVVLLKWNERSLYSFNFFMRISML